LDIRERDLEQDKLSVGAFTSAVRVLASSRDLIDWGIRGRVAAFPNMRIRQGVDVAGLVRGPGGGADVAGVRLRPRPAGPGTDRGRTELADLVVVADGRNSRLPDWLAALGCEPRVGAVARMLTTAPALVGRIFPRPRVLVGL
jgi:2-polyprenyl-6-methoxyphenol hydroxylase-like FAD-dependent oxidoreductase